MALNLQILKSYIELAEAMLYEEINPLPYTPPTSCINGDENFHHAGERAIVFRFGVHLNNLLIKDDAFEEYIVDVEYNRNFNDQKILAGFNGVYPDLIIHKRKSNDYNLLVMEFKGWWTKPKPYKGLDKWEEAKSDITKIKSFIKNPPYHYKFGTFVIIGKEKFKYKWMKDEDF